MANVQPSGTRTAREPVQFDGPAGPSDVQDPTPFDDLSPRAPVWKVPLRAIPADDMPVKVLVEVDNDDDDGGTSWVQDTQFLHAGETVWLAPAVSMATMFTTAGLALFGAEGGREGSRRMVQAAADLFVRLGDCVADWDLTGLDGEALPKPWKNPDAFKVLTDDEVAWLVQKLTGQEPKADRGNGSRGSSSTTGANRRRRPR